MLSFKKNTTFRNNNLTSILPKKEIITEIEGRKLKLSNLNKILFPEHGILKAELIQYYLEIAPYILPHLKDRPLTLIRYPDGVQSHRFYSKNRPNWTPEWIDTIRLEKEDDNVYVMANDVPSLVWMANLASLELHPMQITSSQPTFPDHFIFDLDPPETANFEVVKELALRLKPFLESYGYQPFVKTSGSKGLHVYVPIIQKYDQKYVLECIKELAKAYIRTDKVTTLKMNKEKRQGRVLLDIYRNHKSQTCVAPYSTRGREGAPVSTPLHWDELQSIETSQAYTIQTIFDKINTSGDPWQDFREKATPLHLDKSPNSNSKASTSKNIKEEKISLGVKSTMDAIEVKPMLATLRSKIPSKTKYSFEIKWDGIRIVVIKNKDKVIIMSRKGNDLTTKFPAVHEYFKSQPIAYFIVDGELVVFNKDGTPNFSKIVGRMHLTGKNAIHRASKREKAVAYLFDAMYTNGWDIRNETLEKRRDWLKRNIQWSDQIKFSENFENGSQLLEGIRAKNMEGIMCKLIGSRYESDNRSASWIKVKVQNEDHALIIGYTKGKGDRSNLFGALHLAKIIDKKYVYFGKVGTGFNQARLKDIMALLVQVEETKKPIDNIVEDEKNTVWIRPDYSCDLKYASMSSNDTYREPVFIKLKKETD